MVLCGPKAVAGPVELTAPARLSISPPAISRCLTAQMYCPAWGGTSYNQPQSMQYNQT